LSGALIFANPADLLQQRGSPVATAHGEWHPKTDVSGSRSESPLPKLERVLKRLLSIDPHGPRVSRLDDGAMAAAAASGISHPRFSVMDLMRTISEKTALARHHP